MFNQKDTKVSVSKKKPTSDGMIKPLKDWRIVCNADDIKLVKGVEIKVPSKYLPGLKIEGVI
jgi:hypothetical protein